MDRFYQKKIYFWDQYYWVLFAALIFYAAFLCFYRLDAGYVVSWDEARHGISAYEMLQNKNFIVNTVNYAPDYWNLKPPLSFYGIMAGFGIFGYSVVGLRFYSALSYFLMCILCTLYMKKHHGKLSSLICLAFLCCNQLIFKNHGARAGDADALYQLFFTAAMLAMMEIPEKHSRCYICGICFSLAFLTKSYHALIILGIGGLYMLFSGLLREFKMKEWLIFTASTVIPLFVWGIARYRQDGLTFFLTMISEDVLNRSKTVTEGHAGPVAYYLRTYFLDGEKIYVVLLIIVLAGFFHMLIRRTERWKKFLGYLLWFFVPFLGFSLVKTKLIWYNFPIFVPLMMMAAILLGNLIESGKQPKIFRNFLLTVTCFIVVFYAYKTLQTTLFSEKQDQLQQFVAESTEKINPCGGAHAFVQAPQEIGDGSVWNANLLFVAEISGDYRCCPYGVDGYLKCREPKVLYISREDYTNMKNILVGEILYETEKYLMLGEYL